MTVLHTRTHQGIHYKVEGNLMTVAHHTHTQVFITKLKKIVITVEHTHTLKSMHFKIGGNTNDIFRHTHTNL